VLKARIASGYQAAYTVLYASAITIFKALSRVALNYPRATVATVLSVLILTGVVLTQPSKRIPVAELSSAQPVVRSTEENLQPIPKQDQTKTDATAPNPVDPSALETKTADVSTAISHSDAVVEKLNTSSSEVIPTPAPEQLVALPDESATSKSSAGDKFQVDLLAQRPAPAVESPNIPPLAALSVPPEVLELPREDHEHASSVSSGPNGATTVTENKADKSSTVTENKAEKSSAVAENKADKSSAVTESKADKSSAVAESKADNSFAFPLLNEGVSNPNPVAQGLVQSGTAKADSQNGLTERTAKPESASTALKPVAGGEAGLTVLPDGSSTLRAEQSRNGAVLANSSPMVENLTAPVKIDAIKNAPELHPAEPLIASLDQAISKSELAKVEPSKTASQSKGADDGKAGKRGGAASGSATLPATAALGAGSEKKTESGEGVPTTGISAGSGVSGAGLPKTTTGSAAAAIVANPEKDLSSSAHVAQNVLPKEPVKSPDSQVRPSEDKSSVATPEARIGRDQSGTGEVPTAKLAVGAEKSKPSATSEGTEKSKPSATSEGNESRDRGPELAGAKPTSTMISSPNASDGPAPKVDPSASMPNKTAGQTPSPVSEPSSAASQSNWVTVPSNEKILENLGPDSETVGARVESGSLPARDPRAHADKSVDIEVEAAESSALSRTRSPDRTTTGLAKSLTESTSEQSNRIQGSAYTPHVVERGENFWTISRQYFATGNYWIALWKCNSAKVPEIDKLQVGDVIMIPPVEDLDLAATDPRLAKRTSKRASSMPSGNQVGATSIDQVRRSSDDLDHESPNQGGKFDSADDEIGADRANRRVRYSRVNRELLSTEASDSDAVEPDVDSTSRPTKRSAQTAKTFTYRIRRYDTIRSIARDMLGDSRRAREILEINKTTITDPDHLVIGQLIELPQDARQRENSLHGE
jgi:nucleoid-associated protein YgaU